MAKALTIAECNLCGARSFIDYAGRAAAMCTECGSVERTRALKLILDHFKLIWPGARVLHIAPELGIARHIHATVGEGYDPVDLAPERYREVGARRFDLAEDAARLPGATYDLILHSHVMEHITCDVTSVLWHLHRAIKFSGKHVFCVPIMPGYYESDLSPALTPEQRFKRFGLHDHVRRFGAVDLEQTLGMVFDLEPCDLPRAVGEETLRRFNIPESAWQTRCNSHTFSFSTKAR